MDDNFEINNRMEDIIQAIENGGMTMTEKDIDLLSQIFSGESAFEDIVEALIRTDQTENLKVWVTIMLNERERLKLPKIKYDYEKGLITLAWPGCEPEYLFRSLSEERKYRDRVSREKLITRSE